MRNYSVMNLLKQGLKGHKDWELAWGLSTTPKNSYDAVIIGGGGHGLATAYYMAKEHGMTCLLYTSPSPRDKRQSRMPSSA